jgi:simple sugar transport system ATP-binding protein
MAERLIELRNVAKSYGRVFAVGGVNLHVDRGEVVGLLGDNGAGKSTLIKMLAGAIRPTSGDILVRGKPAPNWNAARSRDAGIETVFQDRALAVQQSIVRNIFMGREITTFMGFLDTAKEHAEAERLMREIGFTSKVFTPDSIVGQLSGGERQGVALARAIYNKADLIVMDEPTTALSLTETEKVFRFVRTVRAGGRSILFIGHNIHHVYDIADRFVVIDRGRVALEASKQEVGSAQALIDFMEHTAHPQGAASFDPTAKPGTTKTGTAKPGTTKPGTTKPGTTKPETTRPGTTRPGAAS